MCISYDVLLYIEVLNQRLILLLILFYSPPSGRQIKQNIWYKIKEKLEVRDVLPNINRTQASERAEKCCSLPWWPWSLTSDLAFQTPPSEGPNMSSVWIWRKSDHWFPKYFIHKQKHRVTAPKKQRLPQFIAVHCVWQKHRTFSPPTACEVTYHHHRHGDRGRPLYSCKWGAQIEGQSTPRWKNPQLRNLLGGFPQI